MDDNRFWSTANQIWTHIEHGGGDNQWRETVVEILHGVAAEAWAEGFNAGEADYTAHTTFDEPCTPNPYRKDS